MLVQKSLTELRGIAQSFNVPDIFQKDHLQLVQAIEMKQANIAPVPKVDIPKPEYDARLMLKPPSKKSESEELEALLKPYIERGLNFEIYDNGERWRMSYGKRNDDGTMRMPLRVALRCAQRIME